MHQAQCQRHQHGTLPTSFVIFKIKQVTKQCRRMKIYSETTAT